MFLVEGLGGEKKLNGTISISGSKNTFLPLAASSLLFEGEVRLKNIPEISDLLGMFSMLQGLGAEIAHHTLHEVTLSTDGVKSSLLSPEIAKKMRGSVLLSGPTLARLGLVSFPHPGGCVIGERPIDLFLSGFEKMGAEVELSNEIYTVTAERGRLRGAEIFFPIQSVTGTETFLMAGVLAEGTTIIKNAALEPEIESLANFLVKGGAKISGIGTTTLMIEGRKELLSLSEEYEVIPDRIEAGSMVILGALCGDNLEITNLIPKHIESLLNALLRSGVEFEKGERSIIFRENGKRKNESFHGVNIRTHEYPGFPTDLQAPMVVFLSQVSGESLVFETIFEGRLGYAEDIIRMGANIKVWDAHRATVKGPSILHGRRLESPDLRAGLAFIIAALVSSGESTIENIHYIDRGYEKIEERLARLGAKIKRVRN